MEYMKTIPGYPGYSINGSGTKLMNKQTGQLVPFREKGNILVASVYRDFAGYEVSVARLVLLAFYGQPKGRRWADWKDGNRHNNSVGNLQWSETRPKPLVKASGKHSKPTRRKPASTKGVKNALFTGFYVVDGIRFSSSIQAAEVLKLPQRTVYRRCKVKPNKFSNFFFEPISGLKMK